MNAQVRTFDLSSGRAVDVTGQSETTNKSAECELLPVVVEDFDVLGNNPAFGFWNDPEEDVY